MKRHLTLIIIKEIRAKTVLGYGFWLSNMQKAKNVWQSSLYVTTVSVFSWEVVRFILNYSWKKMLCCPGICFRIIWWRERFGNLRQNWPCTGKLEGGQSVCGGTLLFSQTLYMFDILIKSKREVQAVSKDATKLS